jgi:peptidoglycan/LPS O-acetylase OafA/YrhL
MADKNLTNEIRYDHIDALRAIAALIVVWWHTEGVILPGVFSIVGSATNRFVDPGRVAVVLFFAISGFVIPSTLDGSIIEGTRRFLIRRFCRLYPAYWFSIPIGWLSAVWLDGRQIDLSTVLANVSMTQKFYGYPDIIGVYWTLSIELVFYFICLILFLARVARYQISYLFVSVLGLLSTMWYIDACKYIYQVDHGYSNKSQILDGFYRLVVGAPFDAWGSMVFLSSFSISIMGLGALLRFVHDGTATRITKLSTFFLASYLLIYYIIIPTHGAIFEKLPLEHARTYLSHGIPVVMFLFFVFVFKIRSKIMGYIGVISYSIYLLHGPIIHLLSHVLRGCAEWPGCSAPLGVYVFLVFCLSIGAAALVYAYVEKPSIERGRCWAAMRHRQIPASLTISAETSP